PITYRPAYAARMRLNVHHLGDPSGRPLLAIHGVSGHGLRYRDFVELAAPDRDVISVDLRGHGRSGWEPPWDVITHLDDILETLEAEGIDESIDVMGHSFGGLLALSLVTLAPDLVQRAVLIDPAIALPVDYCVDRANEVIEFAGWASPEEAIEARKRTVAESAHRFVPGEIAEHVEQGPDGRWRARFSRPAAITAWSEMAHAAPLPEEPRPVLILRAARDMYVTPALIDPLRAALGDEVEVVDIDAAHMIYCEQPEAAAAEIRRFLS
ncbi:MAG: alpha/beta fold hydrolase, partial [Gaiellales bacterium]